MIPSIESVAYCQIVFKQTKILFWFLPMQMYAEICKFNPGVQQIFASKQISSLNVRTTITLIQCGINVLIMNKDLLFNLTWVTTSMSLVYQSLSPTPPTSHQSPSSSRPCNCAMVSLCQSQQRCMKASIVSSWRLAEAQDQLCSLGVHSSESLEQERARTLACPTELTHTEEEWRRKESMLGGSRSPVLGVVGSWDVFDKVSVQFLQAKGNRGENVNLSHVNANNA